MTHDSPPRGPRNAPAPAPVTPVMPLGRAFVLLLTIATLSRAATTPDRLFDPTTAHTIHVRLSADDWALLQPGAAAGALREAQKKSPSAPPTTLPGVSIPAGESFAYVAADVEFDGETLKDVGLRFKGNFTYSVSAATIRRPMKLDFARFTPGRKFAGVSTLNLSNQASDPSQLRETLAFELFRQLKTPAPRTGFALVYLTVAGTFDREFLGLYTLIEEVDKDFLRHNYKNDAGLLMKPGGFRGLADLGDDWKSYAPLYAPKDPAVDPVLAQRVVDLAKLTHRADDATFAAQVESLLDVDGFLAHVAANSALANFDSFLCTGHNYYIYVNPADRRCSFIAWDMNMSFGGYTWVGTDEQIADTRIRRPYYDHNRLIQRILSIPKHRDAYRKLNERIAAGPFAGGTFRQRLAALDPILASTSAAAAKAGKLDSPTTRPVRVERLDVPDLSWFVDHRRASIVEQLAGKREGFVPGFFIPGRVLEGWDPLVGPADALLKALDADRDERVGEPEFSAAVGRLLKDKPKLDAPALSAALEPLLTPALRRCATADAWAAWIVKVADTSDDRHVDAGELLVAWRRHCKGSDRDHDLHLAGREMIEALGGTGVPN